MVKELKRTYFFGLPCFIESKSEIATLVAQLQDIAQVEVDSYFINGARESDNMTDIKVIGLSFATKKARNAFRDSQDVRDFYVKTMEAIVHKKHLSAWVEPQATTIQ